MWVGPSAHLALQNWVVQDSMIYSDVKSWSVTRMWHYRAGAFASWAGTRKVSYLYRCSICYSWCPLDCGGEILAPSSREKSSFWDPSSRGWGQDFALLKVGKRDVHLFLDITNLLHGSPVQKTVSNCWGSAVLESAMEQAGCRSPASPAGSDCHGLVLVTGLCSWFSASSSAKVMKHVLIKAKSEDSPLKFPIEKVRSNDFAFLMLLLGKSNLCWAHQDWQDFERPKGGPPDLGLVLDHSNPGWPLSLLLYLVCLIPAQKAVWVPSPQRGWVLSQWEASVESRFPLCCEKKTLCFLPHFKHHLKLHSFIWSCPDSC